MESQGCPSGSKFGPLRRFKLQRYSELVPIKLHRPLHIGNYYHRVINLVEHVCLLNLRFLSALTIPHCDNDVKFLFCKGHY
jgi:hypothetical protein